MGISRVFFDKNFLTILKLCFQLYKKQILKLFSFQEPKIIVISLWVGLFSYIDVMEDVKIYFDFLGEQDNNINICLYCGIPRHSSVMVRLT